MKVIAAYMLAVLGGNTSPTADDVKKILGSVGAEVDNDRIELLLSQMKDKEINEVVASGREKLASVVPSGGAVAGVAPAAGNAGAADTASAEQKKEEKVEDEEEEDGDLGDIFGEGGLFGSDD
ncbi:PREDICTED: 60S acidic ribosomal protein P2B-like [Fragaria vesca subsp. vesca]|uniref:60S acidic ribosomal protein P2B-like n=1 Tax=Fragaria vesca subsp. vesca TaxID=101020 RepID=UPI0002C32479|nr:PREDICTED: 60S acidic ribosomal protein P2B-like [Fragaria vesca subsp. vesca]